MRLFLGFSLPFSPQGVAEFLDETESGGLFFVGKFLDAPFELSSLDSLEAHILSVMRIYQPECTFHPCEVFALPQ